MNEMNNGENLNNQNIEQQNMNQNNVAESVQQQYVQPTEPVNEPPKKNNSLVVILILIIVGLAGFIVYDKVLKKEEVKEPEQKEEVNNNSSSITDKQICDMINNYKVSKNADGEVDYDNTKSKTLKTNNYTHKLNGNDLNFSISYELSPAGCGDYEGNEILQVSRKLFFKDLVNPIGYLSGIFVEKNSGTSTYDLKVCKEVNKKMDLENYFKTILGTDNKEYLVIKTEFFGDCARYADQDLMIYDDNRNLLKKLEFAGCEGIKVTDSNIEHNYFKEFGNSKFLIENDAIYYIKAKDDENVVEYKVTIENGIVNNTEVGTYKAEFEGCKL